MKEDELRKSMRRQKLEKQGLSVAILTQSAASTGTGTGTSDDEDDASTPSGDNAERSLASTLGGSSESIPQHTSSTFLQAALDGPGSLSDKERGEFLFLDEALLLPLPCLVFGRFCVSFVILLHPFFFSFSFWNFRTEKSERHAQQ